MCCADLSTLENQNLFFNISIRNRISPCSTYSLKAGKTSCTSEIQHWTILNYLLAHYCILCMKYLTQDVELLQPLGDVFLNHAYVFSPLISISPHFLSTLLFITSHFCSNCVLNFPRLFPLDSIGVFALELSCCLVIWSVLGSMYS